MNLKTTQKLIALLITGYASQALAISSNMSHRILSTSPLFYKMMDYSKQQTCFEVEPIFSSMYDASRTNENIILNGKSSLNFDQQGNGDLNPVWINLMSNNSLADYSSTVTFSPKSTQAGALFHWYSEFDSMFVDARTALVQTKTEIAIDEVGGGNGLNSGILNAQQAFTQSDWNYGKIGQANHVVGLDNIELRVGGIYKATSYASTYDLLFAGFGIIEAPTGSGTKAEWLFEPQVGTNHWGVGFGFEALVSSDDDLNFMIAANYRYLTPAWETRSFDLLGNGQWSRYLSVQDTYGLPTAPATLGLPGINYFTQQACINGRSALNIYTRLQKQFKSAYFEISYNLLCVQRETIGAIKELSPGYGVYALTGPAGGSGGATTSSTATINQDTTVLESLGSPIAVTTNNFDKLSAAASTYATNNVTARLEIHNNKAIYGFGLSLESALSSSALSTWSVWAQFGFLFDNIVSDEDDYEFSADLYDFDPDTVNIEYHNINMDDASLPDDVIDSVEDHFIEKNIVNTELDDALSFEKAEHIHESQKSAIIEKSAELHHLINNVKDEVDNFESRTHSADIIEENSPMLIMDEFEYVTKSRDNQNLQDMLDDDDDYYDTDTEDDLDEIDFDKLYEKNEELNKNITIQETYEENEQVQETLEGDISKNVPIITKEKKTISLQGHSVNSDSENGIKVPSGSDQNIKKAPVKNKTVPLKNPHAVVNQKDNGVHLLKHKINHDTAQTMSEDDISNFLHHAKKNNKKPLTEKEILNKLDSKK